MANNLLVSIEDLKTLRESLPFGTQLVIAKELECTHLYVNRVLCGKVNISNSGLAFKILELAFLKKKEHELLMITSQKKFNRLLAGTKE